MSETRINREQIKLICREYRVRELYVFGSVLRSDYAPHSDIDFAVRFNREGYAGSFDQYFDFKAALKKLLARPVDLICLPAVQNPVFRKQLDETKDLVYAA